MKNCETIDAKLLDLAIRTKLDMYVSNDEINDMIDSDEILTIDRHKLSKRVVKTYNLPLDHRGFMEGIPVYKWIQQALSEFRREYL